jgi:uncharacterized protein YqgV (UPF0045/DUF77 family)
MYISVELSFYPLREDFKPPVNDVIAKLQSFTNIEIHANRMSTQLFGEFKDVTEALNKTVEWSFSHYGFAVFVAKFMNGDRRPRIA